MRQIALDIGLASGPTLHNFFAGPNEAVLLHLQLWLGDRAPQTPRSPVPTYLWGMGGSGKTHLLRAVQRALSEQGAGVGWLDAGVHTPAAFDDQWAAVLLDDVQLYTAAQQQAAFNWFVNAQTHQRWVLAAGDVAPGELRLREDLRTRLGWGHLFGLQVLGESDRCAVLRQAADERGEAILGSLVDYATEIAPERD